MAPSAVILYLACTVIFGCFVAGAFIAAAKAGENARAHALTAAGIFVVFFAAISFVSSTGFFANFEKRPPPFLFLLIAMLSTSVAIAFSPLGALLAKELSWSALVGFQGFRVLAELVIHFGYVEGIAPRALSFHGYNFDIVPAVLALVGLFYLRKNPSVAFVKAFNVLGLLTLMVIAFIAITSMPLPIRVFLEEPSNAWVTMMPYTLLPGILVTAAFTGHLLLVRKITLRAHRAR